jgi:3-hydroxyisobutyrate dehydrogenase
MARLEGTVHNQPIATMIVTAFDAFALSAKARLDLDIKVQLIGGGTGCSFANGKMTTLPPSVRFRCATTISIMDKDAAPGLEEAHAQDMPIWTIEQAARVWRFAANQGGAGKDPAKLPLVVEGWAGAGIRNHPKD